MENNNEEDTPECFGMMDIRYDDGECQECQFTRECIKFTNESIDGDDVQ